MGGPGGVRGVWLRHVAARQARPATCGGYCRWSEGMLPVAAVGVRRREHANAALAPAGGAKKAVARRRTPGNLDTKLQNRPTKSELHVLLALTPE